MTRPPSSSLPRWPEIKACFSLEDDISLPAPERARLNSDKRFERPHTEMYDVQFCPFQPINQPPVFALLTLKHIIIGQLYDRPDGQVPYEILTTIREDDTGATQYSCTWARDENDDPVICVAGSAAVIKVYRPNGDLIRCLVGHGGDINSLETSPADPHVLASASKDCTLRLWNLSEAFKASPCVCIFGGDTHSDDILTIAFHQTGRWILSAGQDLVIALWAVPTLPESPEKVPRQVVAPQFASSEIHDAIVDSVLFWADLIISRDCHEGGQIIVWRIEGFSSAQPLPEDAMAPFSHEPNCFSRSAFAASGHTNAGPFLWSRMFRLAAPHSSTQFFMRMGLFTAATAAAAATADGDGGASAGDVLLGFCDAQSCTSFWNLRYIGEYAAFVHELRDAEHQRQEALAAGRPWMPLDPSCPLGIRRPAWLSLEPSPLPPATKRDPAAATAAPKRRRRGLDEADSDGHSSSADGGLIAARVDFLSNYYARDVVQHWEGMYDVSNVQRPLLPHWQVRMEGAARVGRQVGWSPSGEWVVASMNRNTACFMRRKREGDW